jgi:hypothetical protein
VKETIWATPFWLEWPYDDPALEWFDAIAFADDPRQNPEPLIELLTPSVPKRARPYLANLLRNKLGKPKPGSKVRLWDPPLYVALSRMVRWRVKEQGISVKTAVDQVCNDENLLGMFLKINRRKLLKYCTYRSDYNRRWKAE